MRVQNEALSKVTLWSSSLSQAQKDGLEKINFA